VKNFVISATLQQGNLKTLRLYSTSELDGENLHALVLNRQTLQTTAVSTLSGSDNGILYTGLLSCLSLSIIADSNKNQLNLGESAIVKR